MTATKSKAPRTPSLPTDNGANSSNPVLNLNEAAGFLRVTEAAVLDMVQQQGLPGRCIGAEWRFSRAALEVWLVAPHSSSRYEPSALIGAWKDDPHLAEMLEQIYRGRGRPMVEPGR